MAPRLRKFSLTAHIVVSVGWLGAVVCSLTLAVAGLIGQNVETVRAAYLTMEFLGRYVLIPLSLASLLTGLFQALGTKWGLFRHYWVLVKLLMNVFATIVLLLYMQTLSYLAGVASQTTALSGNLTTMRKLSPVLHSGAAILLLLVATTLSVYKPRGITLYGWRKQREERRMAEGTLPQL